MPYGSIFGQNEIAIISVFSLAWFLIGILIGTHFQGRGSSSYAGAGAGRKKSGKLIEIYVGNLSYDVSEKDLRRVFEKYGKVQGARVIINRFNGKSKGFGFVEMIDRDESMDAISSLDGSEFLGRRIVVNEAKSQSKY